jgi:hypothetical protein
MDYTKIRDIAVLLWLPAYQNEGALVDYIYPISKWSYNFSEHLKEKNPELVKDLIDFTGEPDIEEIVRVQPSFDNPIEFSLLLEWSEYISLDPEKMKILGEDLHDYFYWHDEPTDFDYWLDCNKDMPRTPDDAFNLYRKYFE